MKTSDFPTLEKASKKQELRGYSLESFQRALAWLDEGSKAGEIRNTYLDSCKHTLGRLVEKAWNEERKAIDRSQERVWPDALRKLFENLFISGLHDVITANNRLQKSKASGPQVDVLRRFVDEVLPIARVAADLKSKVIKGREPSKGPSKPVNPNKIVKQCPCCYRGIAVGADGTMVHHGYERPGNGSQTPSCWGVSYEPLDVSTKGLEFLISNLETGLERQQNRRLYLETATSISVFRGMTVQKYSKGDKGWARALELEKFQVDHLIRRLRDDLLVAQHVLANWEPGHPQNIPAALELRRAVENSDEDEPSGPKF